MRFPYGVLEPEGIDLLFVWVVMVVGWMRFMDMVLPVILPEKKWLFEEIYGKNHL